jgi:flagellar FliJ protein
MAKSERLTPVIKVAENRERAAAKVLGEIQATVQQRRKRLDELIAYRAEYYTRFTDTGAAARPASMIADFRTFITKLDEAIVKQKQLVAAATHEYEERRSHWLKARTKSMALGKVAERLRLEEQYVSDRKEQKESDERSQRRRSHPDEDD